MPRTQSSQKGLQRRPWHNLRLYLKEATLPDLVLHHATPKLEGTKAPSNEYLLSPEADPRYRLRVIIRYRHSVMNKRVLEFCDENIPKKAISNAESIGTYVRTAPIGLPAKSFPGINVHIPAPPLDVDDLLQWVMVPLLAAERIMNLVWPEETKGFAYVTIAKAKLSKLSRDPDLKLYRPIWWKNTDVSENEDITVSSYKIVILSFLHWALAPGDMQDFIGTTEFPSVQIPMQDPQPRRLSRAEKIWAKLYDECITKNCFRKAVTTYVFNHTDDSPSVLEWLVFWMASAHKIKESYSRGPRHYENADFSRPENITERASSEVPEKVRDWVEELVTIDNSSGLLVADPDIPRTWSWNFRGGE